MKNVIPILIILTAVLSLTRCSENGTASKPPVMAARDTLTLSITQVTHRSISVKLSKTLSDNSRYVLSRISGADTLAFNAFALQQKDTLIIDDNEGQGLALDSEYSYFAYRIDSVGIAKDTSETITATTLAATSHDFTWTEYTLGSGELRDVWGTDENNVYAVGAVKFGDSTFGVIKWDGVEWKPEVHTGGKYAIYGFAEDDIWVGGNGGVIHYNGQIWENVGWDFDNGSIIVTDPILDGNKPYRAIWGTSSTNLYFGSQKGKIIHWDGEKATIVYDTGDIAIWDIHGTGPDNIWFAGTNPSRTLESVILFNGKTWSEKDDLPSLRIRPHSVFVVNRVEQFICGNGVFLSTTNNWVNLQAPKTAYKEKIRGISTNDIFAVGSFNTIYHYNGVDWKHYTELVTEQGGELTSIEVIGQHVFVVGYSELFKSKIIIGNRM